ncbi:hypothetical protein R3P38DRAFT_3015199 [Favolaschia claudopus]|uniref:NACHT domain-containing protein n=1 Tax=Favolaschia claudopus TaxID=2862362 RepID=A0AAW0AJF6_9AGAR
MPNFKRLISLAPGKSISSPTTTVASNKGTSSGPSPNLDSSESKIPEYLTALKEGLEVAITAMEPFVEGTVFQIPLAVVSSVIDLASIVSKNSSDIQTLIQKLTGHINSANRSLSRRTELEGKHRVEMLHKHLKQELEKLEALAKRSRIKRIIKRKLDINEIKDTIVRIDDYFVMFQQETLLAIEEKIHQIQIDDNNQKIDDTLRNLCQASVLDASYDSGDSYTHPPCHPDTRSDYLSFLKSWSSEDTRLLWMHGPAGTGKSAIAQSFCQQLAQNKHLGGSFFFRRGHAARADARKLFPTLAYHLACASPKLKVLICAAFRDDILSKTLEAQIERLIIEPCYDAQLTEPLVIVIDGLDECVNSQSAHAKILQCIAKIPAPLKILVASRPEPHIVKTFGQEFKLQGASSLEIKASLDDVRLYLVDEFQRIQKNHDLGSSLPTIWPSTTILDHLVSKSGGHFIYASTVIRFVEDADSSPQKRLDRILTAEKPHPNSISPYIALDQLYLGILAGVGSDLQPLLLQILSAIAAGSQLCGGFGLSVDILAQLLEQTWEDIMFVLQRLKSVLIVPAFLTDSIGVHHATFIDFLNDASRAHEFYFNHFLRNSLALSVGKIYLLGSVPQMYLSIRSPIKLDFITTTDPFPDLLQQLDSVNLDVIASNIYDSSFRQLKSISGWLEEFSPQHVSTQKWANYVFMYEFDSFCTPTTPPKAIENLTLTPCSPLLQRLFQAYTVFRPRAYGLSSLLFLRWILGLTWEDMIPAICALRENGLNHDYNHARAKIEMYLTAASHPVYIQELYPNDMLQEIAKRCMKMAAAKNTPFLGRLSDRPFRKIRFDFMEALQGEQNEVKSVWSYILRVCVGSPEMEDCVRALVMQKPDVLSSLHQFHKHNIRAWLETFPNPPVDLIKKLPLLEGEAYMNLEADYKQWREKTGF